MGYGVVFLWLVLTVLCFVIYQRYFACTILVFVPMKVISALVTLGFRSRTSCTINLVSADTVGVWQRQSLLWIESSFDDGK